jgi:putative sterol carrier protein
MAIFNDVKLVKELFGELWMELIEKTEFGPSVRENNLSVLFVIKDPDVFMYIDGNAVKWDVEAKNMEAVVTMSMSGDTVHKFWLKKLNIPVALATRQVKTKGPIPKVLKLMPLLKPGYARYEGYCKKYNLPTEI